MRSAADVSGSWSEGPRHASRRGLATVTLGVLALVVLVAALGFSASDGKLGWDVRFAYLPATELILDGESPYPALDDPILEDQKGYVYPPQLALVLTPLAFLPVGLASFLAACAMVALLALTLWIVGLRDPLCYAAAALWVPSISGILLSNLSIPLACALAIVWRYRDSSRLSGPTLGLAVSAKLVLWPMFVWTLAMRRVRATLLALAVGIAVTLVAWALIGFAGFGAYPDLVQRLSEIQAENSYSIVGMASTLGLDDWVGRALTLAVGGALLIGCVLFARAGDDARSFTCAVAATLAVSPIVWLHYLVVLVVPMAILRPRFSVLWLLPVLLWVSPKPGYAEGYATFVPALATVIVVAALLAPRPAPREAAPTS